MTPPIATFTETVSDTVSQSLKSLNLRSTETEEQQKAPITEDSIAKFEHGMPDTYRYTNLLPVFDRSEHYDPLVPFVHVDPGARALNHPNPRSFLDAATIVDITPAFGSEIRGVDLISLDSDSRDQLALEVARRGVLVFRNQEGWLSAHPDEWLEFGKHFGRLHIHPTSGHPAGYPELHLVYRDVKATFNFEREDRISTTTWHSDVSYEQQPPGTTTFFLLAQRKSY